MSDIRILYNKVYASMKSRCDAISAAMAENAAALASQSGEISSKIQSYREKIAEIDETLPQIEDLLVLAGKYVDHRTLPTVSAPEGYRVNIQRLKTWAQLIDPLPRDESPEGPQGDPYAQRIYMVASCDKKFLNDKKEKFGKAIRKLEDTLKTSESVSAEQSREKMRALEQQLLDYLSSDEFTGFADEVKGQNADHSYAVAPHKYKNASSASGAALGIYKLLLPAPEGEIRRRLESIFGEALYDAGSSAVSLPYVLAPGRDYAVSVRCTTVKTGAIDRGLQNFMLDVIQRSPAGTNRVYLLDCARFKSTGLGLLRPLEGSFAVAPVPRITDQITETLENLVSHADEIDEAIGSFDTLAEYNLSVPAEKRKARTTLILIGWPNGFESSDSEIIRRLMINHERYGITFIAVTFDGTEMISDDKSVLPGYVEQTAIHIEAKPASLTLQDEEEKQFPFVWYEASENLGAGYEESLRVVSPVKTTLGNEYPKRIREMSGAPAYIGSAFDRQYKKIELPFGVSSKDELMNISFENENFAAFVMGASRSGKSTFIHTLISGIISNYHPDNVELWLADFKQLEFKKYMDHCPPHVKYILLDESPELVYDLLDKLTEKMMERQRLFAKLGTGNRIVDKIDQIDTTKLPEPLPVIFVILDEFSIMSQAIEESDIYMLRLQNLLAKGAALGIRFLFSSQTFSTGTSGLTNTAKGQIQQRIAMKGKADEIEETLDLNAALKTEKVKNWMAALPPHYALVKCSQGPDKLPEVLRSHVLYFPKTEYRYDYIDELNRVMKPTEVYDPKNNACYVNKHPVMVDGNSYKSFRRDKMAALYEEYRRANAGDVEQEDIILSLGVPRRMSENEFTVLTEASRENMLLIAPNTETACAMSMVWTMAESVRMQGGNVSVWAYERNRLYRTYKDSHFSSCAVAEGMDEICDAIRVLKNDLREHRPGRDLIILLGMDQICLDFEYIDRTEGADNAESDREYIRRCAALEAKTAEELYEVEMAQAWEKANREFVDAAIDAGKSDEEILKELEEQCDRFCEEYEAEHPRPESEEEISDEEIPEEDEETASGEEPEKAEEEQSGAYNAIDDFIHVVKYGSRMGYHFIAVFSSVSDVNPCELKVEYFRHKMAFQIPEDDSRTLFDSKIASLLPERICQYDNGTDRYSVRPYLHSGILWDGWDVDENGNVVSPLL